MTPMSDDFLGLFIGTPTRARVLRIFVFNQNQSFTLAHAMKRAGATSAVAMREIKALEKIGIVKKGKFAITLANGTRVVQGKQKEKTWSFNPAFKYAAALSKFVHEVSPIHYKNILVSLRRAGRLVTIILSGSFMGDASRPADLIVAGDSLNESRLEAAVRALEPQLGREIRYASFSTPEFRYRMTIQDRLLRDTLDYPHLILLDKTKLL